MVTFLRNLPALLPAGACLLAAACNNDILGLFGSTSLAERWRDRNTFTFLDAASRTLALGDDYAFIVLADTHIEKGNAFGLEAVKDLLERDREIAFAVIAGDVTQCGYREDIETFIEIARSLPVPCYPVLGNHDIFFGNWPNWRDLIGSSCYRIDGGGTSLFMLDSANGFLGKNQIDWLEQELASAQGRVFVFSHMNFFLESPLNIDQFTDIRERARILALLKGRCDAMFMGHLHLRTLYELGGVHYISVEDFQTNSVYCRVSVSKNTLRWEFKRLDAGGEAAKREARVTGSRGRERFAGGHFARPASDNHPHHLDWMPIYEYSIVRESPSYTANIQGYNDVFKKK